MLRNLQNEGRIQLLHFPYDPDSRSKYLTLSEKRSRARWSDMNTSWEELRDTSWSDHSESEQFESIEFIIGKSHRRDILHVDTAYKEGCRAFITSDNDILSKKDELEQILGIKFFHPLKDQEKLMNYLVKISDQK